MLSKDFPELKKVKSVEIAYYMSIVPISAISIYTGSGNTYVFGTPNAVITGLRIRYWS